MEERAASNSTTSLVERDIMVDPLLVYLQQCSSTSSSSNHKEKNCNENETHDSFMQEVEQERIRDKIQSALITDGYVVLPNILSSEECQEMLDLLWDYVETTSDGQQICRHLIPTWYPSHPNCTYKKNNNNSNETDNSNSNNNNNNNDTTMDDEEDDPWPYTKTSSSQPDLFQTADSGYVLGKLREILAQRVYEPLVFQTRELYSSKEGFTFHRPRKVSTTLDNVTTSYSHPYYQKQPPTSTNSPPSSFTPSLVPDPTNDTNNGIPTIRSYTAFVSQSPQDQSLCFSVYPGSHAMQLQQQHHQQHLAGKEQGQDHIVLNNHVFSRKDIYVNAGDVVLWRSDLLLSTTNCSYPGPDCTIFGAVGYVSMIPVASATTALSPLLLQKLKFDGYRTGRTTDHRPYLECWNEIPGEILISPNCKRMKDNKDNSHGSDLPQPPPQQGIIATNSNDTNKICNATTTTTTNETIIPSDHFYHRYSPPLVTWRQAELYGLVPYGIKGEKEFQRELQRALIRGICFQHPILSSSTSTSIYGSFSCTTTTTSATNGSSRINSSDPNSNISKLLSNSVVEVPDNRPRIINPKVMGNASTAGPKVAILSPTDPPLLGQDKWLGGMPSPDGLYIYGVPGSAPQVLRITVEDGKIDFIGPKYTGKFKWLRGIEIPPDVLMNSNVYPKGVCLALPANADSILEINPHTQEVSTYGGPFPGCWKWHGGAISPINGIVYAIPANAEQVLRINPRIREAKLIGPKFVGPQKWYGGLCASNGCIYGIAQNAGGILKIEPSEEEGKDNIYVFGQSIIEEGNWKWHGGAITADGRFIYGFPNNSDYVLKIDTETDEISFLGGPDILRSGRQRIGQEAGKYKYLGGAVASNEHLYLFPSDAEQVLSINTRTDELKLVGPLLLEGRSKFQNGFCARDGSVYGIPQNSRGVLRISPNKDDPHLEPDVDLLYCGEQLVSTKDKFEGGVLGPKDGCIYCMPLRAKRALKVIPAPVISDR